MSKYIVDIHGDIEGDYDIVKKYEEPKTGHWIEIHPLQEDDGGAYMCSICKCGHPYIAPHWKYCPYCGTKMESEAAEQ